MAASKSDEDIDYSESEDEEEPQNFVAWLEPLPDATEPCVCIGEVHYSNVELTKNPQDRGTYCVVFELSRLAKDGGSSEAPVQTGAGQAADEKTDATADTVFFSFNGGFPFRVVPVAACIAVPLLEVANSEAAVGVAHSFALPMDIFNAVRSELLKTDMRVPSGWCVPTPRVGDVVKGVAAWLKAGEKKSGWDLQRIPAADRTSQESLVGYVSSDEHKAAADTHADPADNVLLQLYGALCAYKPLKPSASVQTIEERFEWRTCLCSYFAWAVPNEAALAALANLGPILEIGAGTGYWAWLLSKRGVDIVAYDAADSHEGLGYRFRHSLVQDGGVEQAAAPEHSQRALFLCWPDIVGDSATDDADRGTFGADCLRAYKGDIVVYVGELGPNVVRAKSGWGDPFPPGGSSASAAFQEHLHAAFELRKRVTLPNWPPYNSHMYIFDRKQQMTGSKRARAKTAAAASSGDAAQPKPRQGKRKK